MGTRSLTFVHDGPDESAPVLLCFYRQYDGRPTGHGQDLADFLAPKRVCNGYQLGMKPEEWANGIGDLAAQLVATMKSDEYHRLGGVYIYAADSKAGDCGDEYVYRITVPDGGGIAGKTEDRRPVLAVYSSPDHLLWRGDCRHFDAKAVEKVEVDE